MEEKAWLKNIYRLAKESAENSFGKIIALFVLIFGGLILLSYSLSIEYLPDFTLSDLTGTIIAIFVVGTMVVAAISGYLGFAGFAARWALGLFYPARERYGSGGVNGSVSETPYERVVRGRFIEGVTFGTAFAGAFFILNLENFAVPHNRTFIWGSILGGVPLAILLMIDWRLHRGNWFNYAKHVLIMMSAAGSLVLFALINGIAVDVGGIIIDSKGAEAPAKSSFSWKEFSGYFLDHVWCVSLVMVILGSAIAYYHDVIRPGRRSPHTGYTKRPRSQTSEWKKLLAAKVVVAIVFAMCSLVVLALAESLSRIGGAMSVIGWLYLLIILIMVNWIAFNVRSWKERIGLGLAVSVSVAFLFPLILGNPAFLSKTIVGMLGLGNVNLSAITMAEGQCKTLVPFAVPCRKDEDNGVTLLNVNLLNRLGTSFVLEIMVRFTEGDSPENLESEKAEGSQAVGNSSLHVLTLAPGKSSHARIAARTQAYRCEKGLLSLSGKEQDGIGCVRLVVPKEQVVSYSLGGRRTYAMGYTLLQTLAR